MIHGALLPKSSAFNLSGYGSLLAELCVGGLALSGAALRAAEEVPRGSVSQPSKDDSRPTIGEEGPLLSMPESRRTRPRGVSWPPDTLKGIYLSFWSAGSGRRVGKVTKLAGNGWINAVVIDVKDVIGRVGYDAKVPETGAHGARMRIIADLESVACTLHGAGLYVIARMAVFKDTKLAGARPRLAIHSRRAQPAVGLPHLSVDTLWRKAHREWLDPVAEDVWAYNAVIAVEVFRAGVDEVNLDYIRFPTDGDLRDMPFPVRRATVSRREVLRLFSRAVPRPAAFGRSVRAGHRGARRPRHRPSAGRRGGVLRLSMPDGLSVAYAREFANRRSVRTRWCIMRWPRPRTAWMHWVLPVRGGQG